MRERKRREKEEREGGERQKRETEERDGGERKRREGGRYLGAARLFVHALDLHT